MPGEAEARTTRALAEEIRGIAWDGLPDDVRAVAHHCLLDFFGVALAGAGEALTGILVKEVVLAEAGTEAGLIGRPERATKLTAALVNGAAAHALDYDDTHTTMAGHPSVPVLPALLALAEAERSDGRAFLTALVAGIELECRLGVLLGGGHYLAGFHATGTLGTFGAAAACAHLLGLDGERWLHALGLAGTQAAGLKSAFGTMAKPLHAGRAASAGLLSALLARGGYTAQADVLETPQGFAATHAGGELSPDALAPFAGRFLIRDTLFKFHAACYLTHAAIEAALQLRDAHALDAEKIDSVEVNVAPAVLGVCNIAEPATGLEGKFSLRAAAALALLGEDTSDLATYSAAKMVEPQLVALRDRVRVVATEGVGPTWSRVRIETRGRQFAAELDAGLPATDLLDQGRRLRSKFLALAGPVLGTGRAAELAEAASRVEESEGVADLLRLARPGGDGDRAVA
jgi:2-methylcitrate dehydratase PrpD